MNSRLFKLKKGDKMFKKIAILAIFLLLSISVVSAVDLDDFKLPDGFNKDSSNLASDDDFSLSIADYDKDMDYDLLFKDDGEYTVTVGEISKYHGGDPGNYVCRLIMNRSELCERKIYHPVHRGGENSENKVHYCFFIF